MMTTEEIKSEIERTREELYDAIDRLLKIYEDIGGADKEASPDDQMDFIIAANCSLDRKQQARFTFSLVVDRVARISTMENIIGFESIF